MSSVTGSSQSEPLPAGSLILAAFLCIPFAAFLLGLLGHVGSLHHALHLVLLALGLELVLAAVMAVGVAMFGDRPSV